MDTIIRVISFLGTAFLFCSAVYIFISNLKIKEMQKANHNLGLYIKSKDFLLMKNEGECPCDTKRKFHMPEFSQKCNYIIRRKEL